MRCSITLLTGLAIMLVSAVTSAVASTKDANDSPQRYSYYSPALGTVNLDNTAFEAERIRVHGQPFSSDLIVLTGLSRKLMRLTPEGKVRWMLDVAGSGGAYGLAQFGGLLVICFGPDILLVDPASGQVAHRLPVLTPGPGQTLNFLRVQNDLLIAGESRTNGDLILAQFMRPTGGAITVNILHRVPTRLEAPRDALLLSTRELLVADTFGHAVVRYEFRERWRETRRWAEYFPNMLEWRDGQLTVLSEHANRITRWDLHRNRRRVVVSCPHALFADWRTGPLQVALEEPRTRSSEEPPRQICSADIAGDQTLYAPNGFFDEGNGRLWVADADNHRVALFVNGRFRTAITGINHPARVIPLGGPH